MRSLDEVFDQFAYHPATKDTAKTFSIIRALFKPLAHELWDLVPDVPEKTLALRKLQEAQMYANLAVALSTPADTQTDDVARVMPGTVLDNPADQMHGPNDGVVGVMPPVEPDVVQIRKAMQAQPVEAVDLPTDLAGDRPVIDGLLRHLVVNGSCYGPISAAEGPIRTAVCFHGLCDWTKTFGDGAQTMKDLQNQHDEALSNLLVVL